MSVSEARTVHRLRAGVVALRGVGLLRDQLVVIAFSTVLGAAAGLFPALAAARRNPVEALRSE